MSNPLNTPYAALLCLLEKLYYAEIKIKEELAPCGLDVDSIAVKAEISKYTEIGSDKLQKLERVFHNLAYEPEYENVEVVDNLISETKRMMSLSDSPELKNILMIGCLQNINTYKISLYKTAHLLASELIVDTVSDILRQLLKWEIDAGKIFTLLAFEEFNHARRVMQAEPV